MYFLNPRLMHERILFASISVACLFAGGFSTGFNLGVHSREKVIRELRASQKELFQADEHLKASDAELKNSCDKLQQVAFEQGAQLEHDSKTLSRCTQMIVKVLAERR